MTHFPVDAPGALANRIAMDIATHSPAMAPRSALYIPANKDRAIAKARTLPCDMVILDLEDSVAPDAKTDARAQALTALADPFSCGPAVVRINDLGTSWGADDLRMAATSRAAGVLIPKLSDVATLRDVRAMLPDGMGLWGMVESCAAILDIAAIAREGRGLGLAGFIVGPNDLAKEMGCRPGTDRAPLLTALSMTVMAARAHGLVALDGVYNDFRDAAGLQAECEAGAALGFHGKSLIHPDQIAICNTAFSPSAQDIAHARAIVDAFARPDNAGKGVINVHGEMVELLHLDSARRLLARAEGAA